jgi:hypothetical protein
MVLSLIASCMTMSEKMSAAIDCIVDGVAVWEDVILDVLNLNLILLYIKL